MSLVLIMLLSFSSVIYAENAETKNEVSVRYFTCPAHDDGRHVYEYKKTTVDYRATSTRRWSKYLYDSEGNCIGEEYERKYKVYVVKEELCKCGDSITSEDYIGDDWRPENKWY